MTVTAQPVTDAPAQHYWSGPLVVEDAPTGDRRRVMPDALTARDLPQPLMFQRATPQGGGNPHAGAEWAGRITMLWRDGDTYHGAGPIYPNGPGDELAMFMADGPVGVSVDLDDVDAEVLCLETDEMGDCLVAEQQIHAGRIMGATATAFPAIPEAKIGLLTPDEFAALSSQHEALAAPPVPVVVEVEPHEFVDAGDGSCEVCGQPASADIHVTPDQAPAPTPAPPPARTGAAVWHLSPRLAALSATGAALAPESWFEDPDLTHLTASTITDPDPDTGLRRIFGHGFGWKQSHTALAGRTAPRSATGYAHFKVGAIRASCECPDLGGQVEVPVGTITFGTTHARDLRADPRAVADHYEQTGMVGAYVAMGEDAHGGWFSGVVRPDLTEAQITELRGAALSGDWVWIGGRLELVALLAVNVPGFPIPRERFHVSDGRETRLVASGIVVPERVSLAAQVETMGQRLAAAERTIRLLEPFALQALASRFAAGAMGDLAEIGRRFDPETREGSAPSFHMTP